MTIIHIFLIPFSMNCNNNFIIPNIYYENFGVMFKLRLVLQRVVRENILIVLKKARQIAYLFYVYVFILY